MAAERSFATDVGDLVLIHFEEKPAGFARIEAIRPHDTPGWYFCDLLLLGLPLQRLTWILEQVQIEGGAFTMGGRGVRLARLADPGVAAPEPEEAPAEPPEAGTKVEASAPLGARVVSLEARARRSRRPRP